MEKLRVGLLVLLFTSAVVFADEEKEEKKKDDKKDSIGTVIGIDLGTTYSW